MRLKVPKCEIFDLMDSPDFSTKKPLWVGDFGTIMKNSKLFRFSSWFRKKIHENYELVHVEHALKNCFWELDQKFKISCGWFWTHLHVSKTIFTLWVFFTCFKKFENFIAMHRHFVTACSACVAILLPQAQYTQHIFTRMLSMRSTFLGTNLTCVKCFDSFLKILLCRMSMRKHIF
jgi:hypothetical protein